MANDIGVDILNSMGASRFDVRLMAQTLAEADVSAQRLNAERSETRFNTKLSGFDMLTAAFKGFQSQISTLTDISNFQKKAAVSSDPTVLDASITGSPSNGIYQVEVQNLATSHTLASQTEFASSTSVVGEGNLSFNVGGSVTNIAIDATNNTLSGIQNAVNNADIGVNATVVNVGTGYKLMFSSAQSGAGNAIDVSVTDTDGNNTDALGLSRLATVNMDETVAAQDAQLVVNGLAIQSSTNQVNDVIEGISLNLKSADLGSVKTIEINQDTDGLEQGVKDFVELFNALDDIIKNLGSYEKPDEDAEDQTQGSLSGDSSLRNIKSNIRQAMFESIPNLSGSIQSLADIGITTNLTGKLDLDEAKLSTAISNDPGAVGSLFAANATASDNLVSYKGSTSDTIEGVFNLTVNTAAEKANITGASIGVGGDVTIDATNNTFKVAVDGNQSVDLVLNSGTYTRTDLASEIAKVINNDSNISAVGGKVSVEYDDATQSYSVTSEKFGSASKLELVSGNFLTSGVSGLGVTAETAGTDVQGFLEQNGTLYTFVGQGQDVTINSILDGAPKGLEFSVAGSTTGARGTLEFNRGYADKISNLFDQMLESETGIVGSRIENINDRLDSVASQKEKIDLRYEKLEMKYRIQFGALQSMLAQMDNTRQSLAASLSNLAGSNQN